MKRRQASTFFLLFFLVLTGHLHAQDRTLAISKEEVAQKVMAVQSEVSPEIYDGLNLTLWASDTLIADPITIHIDDQSRVYYSRTFRKNNSEFDIRSHQEWMIRSISLQTVEDRRAFLHEELAPERSSMNTWMADLNEDGSHDWKDLLVEKEQVYRVEDTDDDGYADKVQLIMEDFNEEITDVAGAVMYHNEELFVGVGPDMWRMRDTDEDGFMDWKESISHGYAIHIGFGAHGMSGLTVGPDGRIYWGIGDIGFHGTDQTGKLWDYSNQGVIVRSNPDGSDFEVYAAGLRNTHEFTFDAYGNLISVDNDGDHPGEQERLVYVTNGSDSGWRTNWQFGKYTDPKNNGYNVWMDENLFRPRFEGQAAHTTPPISLYHSGPTGMVYNPGTALGPEWADHFFVSEFVGTPARSHIYAFRLAPKGATFELVEDKEILGGILTTGMEFGPDGALYAADWIDGWNNNNKGRIWKLDVAAEAAYPDRGEVQELLGASFGTMEETDLQELLMNPDQRVRLKAQFALAGRGEAGLASLEQATQQSGHQLARIHGIWGIGQVARTTSLEAAGTLIPLLGDDDAEIRAQAAKILGDVRYPGATSALIEQLEDDSARGRFFAAEALGRIGAEEAAPALIAMLETNKDEDTYLRHAGTLALARIGASDAVLELVDHTSRALRIAAVVTLRRLQHPGIAQFLADEDEYIVTDVARAINDDKSIMGAMPALAGVLEEERLTAEALIRRSINANSRLGGQEHANRLATYAARSNAPEALRVEAIKALAVWEDPSVVDRVDGTYRGPEQRDPAIAREALGSVADALFTSDNETVLLAVIEATGTTKNKAAEAALLGLFEQAEGASIRAAALLALSETGFDGLDTVVEAGLSDSESRVRRAAIETVGKLEVPSTRMAEMIQPLLSSAELEEKQAILKALGTLPESTSAEVLGGLVESVIDGTMEPALLLEVHEAVQESGSASLNNSLQEYEEQLAQTDGLAMYRKVMAGGSERLGRRLFYTNQAAQCTRCHNAGAGGGDVGPPLRGVASELTEDELMQSLVDPSARIAPGYGLVSLTLKDGSLVAGTLVSETDTAVMVKSGNDEPVEVTMEEIANRIDAPSSMPGVEGVLSWQELRDLMAFLKSLD